MDFAQFPRLGILGGGQLARMTLQAAVSFGIDTVVLAEAPDSPAGRLAQHEIVGAWHDQQLLRRFADAVDVVTLENEFVDERVLIQLAEWGKLVRPGPHVLGTIQDKLRQKQKLVNHALPVPDFAAVEHPDDILHYAAHWGWPLILKARRNGYDGYGNATLQSAADIPGALDRLDWPTRQLMVERAVPFACEIAVLIARNDKGQMVTYPVVETIQRQHICHIVRAPAAIDAHTAEQATRIAQAAVAAVQGIGITAVELFVTPEHAVLINELAPRPHNSGHFSIDACVTSQFENHLRGVLGLPLGDPGLRAPAAVMVNLLGSRNGKLLPQGVEQALRLVDVHLHLYGKRETRIGRKLGHLTALGSSMEETELRARSASDMIKL
ncbi:MAG: 5-(carboxyamino)imidazole ribonucleotide synthase [Chloroflexota bacterium]|nr:5-(carboxyamino)imidazole ribonucleotide synthase [Chloroflexota bacterium]